MTFAELCKKHRARSGLFLADQAEALGVSVSLVSAVETGKRNVPEGYPERVAIWLHLNRQESDELLGSAAASSNVIKFKPNELLPVSRTVA